MSEALFCFNCKYFEHLTPIASCTRDAKRDLVYGAYTAHKYSCVKERGYDAEYLSRSFQINHQICGVDGKFFEVK